LRPDTELGRDLLIALRAQGYVVVSEAGLDEALRRCLPADVVYALRPAGDPFTGWARSIFRFIVAAQEKGETGS
jgi:hypothetical protein